MLRITARIVNFLTAEDGPTSVEYAMMVMLIFLVCISAVVTIGQSTAGSFQNSGTEISTSLDSNP